MIISSPATQPDVDQVAAAFAVEGQNRARMRRPTARQQADPDRREALGGPGADPEWPQLRAMSYGRTVRITTSETGVRPCEMITGPAGCHALIRAHQAQNHHQLARKSEATPRSGRRAHPAAGPRRCGPPGNNVNRDHTERDGLYPGMPRRRRDGNGTFVEGESVAGATACPRMAHREWPTAIAVQAARSAESAEGPGTSPRNTAGTDSKHRHDVRMAAEPSRRENPPTIQVAKATNTSGGCRNMRGLEQVHHLRRVPSIASDART